MKTISYNEILYRAAEAAGRTRDNLLASEATVLKSIFAQELRRVWLSEDWDDTREPVLTVALDADKQFSNPYSSTDLGEVLGIFTQTPGGSTPWSRLNFHRVGDDFTVTPKDGNAVPETVYVYYQTECPDLLALSQENLNALEIPLVFGNYLALRGAAHLLTADGDPQLAGVQFGLAESQLNFERTRIQRPEWAK